MGLVLNKSRVVKWPVDVEVPIDGGDTKRQQFTAHFKLLPQETIDAHYTAGGDDSGLLQKVLVGWDDVSVKDDETGSTTPILFSDENLVALVNTQFVRIGTMRAFLGCISGVKRKNSATPPATGPAAAADPAATTSRTN